MDKVRVKTSQGYWYTVGGGRYGRVNGTKEQGRIVCRKHGKEMVKFFEETMNMHAEMERFRGHVSCSACKEPTP